MESKAAGLFSFFPHKIEALFLLAVVERVHFHLFVAEEERDNGNVAPAKQQVHGKYHCKKQRG